MNKKRYLILLIIIVAQSCINNTNKLDNNFYGTWSLSSSNDKNDEYYQIKINTDNIERLYLDGLIAEKNKLEKGKILFLNKHPVSLKKRSNDELEISDGETYHLLRRVNLESSCFCIDANFFHRKFSYEIRQLEERDSLKTTKLKSQIWEHFKEDIDEKIDIPEDYIDLNKN